MQTAPYTRSTRSTRSTPASRERTAWTLTCERSHASELSRELSHGPYSRASLTGLTHGPYSRASLGELTRSPNKQATRREGRMAGQPLGSVVHALEQHAPSFEPNSDSTNTTIRARILCREGLQLRGMRRKRTTHGAASHRARNGPGMRPERPHRWNPTRTVLPLDRSREIESPGIESIGLTTRSLTGNRRAQRNERVGRGLEDIATAQKGQ